jgi:hypothetical protein
MSNRMPSAAAAAAATGTLRTTLLADGAVQLVRLTRGGADKLVAAALAPGPRGRALNSPSLLAAPFFRCAGEDANEGTVERKP